MGLLAGFAAVLLHLLAIGTSNIVKVYLPWLGDISRKHYHLAADSLRKVVEIGIQTAYCAMNGIQ